MLTESREVGNCKRERSRKVRVDCLIEVTEASREYLDHVVQSVPEEKRTWKASPEAWSLKDVLAHIAWHDDQMVEVCEKRDLVGSVWWTLPLEERNGNIFKEYENTPFTEVLEFYETSYKRMIEALKTLADEDLNDPKHFHDMPEEWTPWRMIANNGCEHYIRHVGQVRVLARAQKEA